MLPKYAARTEEIRVHLATGYLEAGERASDPTVQELYVSLDTNGNRQPEYDRCAMCQTAGRSRIQDFRTRGEQPFTALIEAQFAEQPPQKLNPKLPNHGRKVLVFSDGRQKAARLAPALEHSHARDLFRQVSRSPRTKCDKQRDPRECSTCIPPSSGCARTAATTCFHRPTRSSFTTTSAGEGQDA